MIFIFISNPTHNYSFPTSFIILFEELRNIHLSLEDGVKGRNTNIEKAYVNIRDFNYDSFIKKGVYYWYLIDEYTGEIVVPEEETSAASIYPIKIMV